MPRYFFNVDDLPDDEGVEMTDLATAKCEAVKMAGMIVCEEAATFVDKPSWRITVTDATGCSLFRLTIEGSDASAGSGMSGNPVQK